MAKRKQTSGKRLTAEEIAKRANPSWRVAEAPATDAARTAASPDDVSPEVQDLQRAVLKTDRRGFTARSVAPGKDPVRLIRLEPTLRSDGSSPGVKRSVVDEDEQKEIGREG